MASSSDGLAKAPRVVSRPSGLPLWGLWLALCSRSAPKALTVAVPSRWVTWGHCAQCHVLLPPSPAGTSARCYWGPAQGQGAIPGGTGSVGALCPSAVGQ